MVMRLVYGCVGLLCSVVCLGQANGPNENRERTKPASAEELAGISSRGKALAAYDAAAWYGSDAVQGSHPPEGSVKKYLGRKTESGWVIGFGKLNDAKDGFLLIAEVQPTGDVKHPQVQVFDPARVDRGDYFHEALASDVALATFQASANQRYNFAVLPAPEDKWWVYVYPAQTVDGEFPAGGDVRFTLSADGTKLLESKRMHYSILIFKSNAEMKMSYHTAVLDDAPEDSDVANVLMRSPKVTELIATKHFVYRVETDGTVSYLMLTKDLLKATEPPTH
jgi:hypothetical protein